MFKVFKQLGNKENKDLRVRIYFTLAMLFIFVLGISVKVPGMESLGENYDFLQLINTLGGGALNNFSIFALGVMPYITAQIIMQLLEMDIIPYFADLAKQGATGRQKLNQISRYVGIAFAFIEGYAFSFAILKGTGATPLDYLYIATVLTAGTAFLLWIGDQVTKKGLGNGISLIIMGGIIATLPQMFIDVFTSTVVFTGTAQAITLGIIKFILFVVVYLAIVVGVVFEERSERRIPIQYANKSTSYGNAAQSFMPIKINAAGVMPVIFASSLSIIPSIIATVAASNNPNSTIPLIVQKYLTYNTPVGFIIYVFLIFIFSYFYTFVAIKPKEFAKNLQENGGYIPGIKPGEETEKYLSRVLSRITVLGGTFLTILAALPIIFSKVSSLPTSVSIGGTGLLIVVGVALETYKQLEGSLLTRSYKRGYSRR